MAPVMQDRELGPFTQIIELCSDTGQFMAELDTDRPATRDVMQSYERASAETWWSNYR